MKKILIEIGHPAHVHQFRNLYNELVGIGWKGLFVTKEKECAVDLLEHYRLPYVVLGTTKQDMLSKILSLPGFAIKMFKVAKRFDPDIFVSRVSPLSGWSSFILRKPHITFTDTENVKQMDAFSEPFADVVLTSTTYLRKHRKKHLRYPGYHELAYLHPNRFVADYTVLDVLGINKGERYAIVRFVAWTAHHDVGMKGMTFNNKLRLVRELSKHMKVFISSEAELPEDLKEYQVDIMPEDMHNVLAFADIFVGESSTMATEAGVLGVPAVYINNSHLGYIKDLAKHGLIFPYTESMSDQELAIEKTIELASKEDKDIFVKKRDELLSDKIDVTSFMLWFVENYPDSRQKMKQKNFSFEIFR